MREGRRVGEERVERKRREKVEERGEKLFTFCDSMTAGCYTSDVMYVSPPERRGEDNNAAATGPRNYGTTNGMLFYNKAYFMSTFVPVVLTKVKRQCETEAFSITRETRYCPRPNAPFLYTCPTFDSPVTLRSSLCNCPPCENC